ncbi:MAG: hypothetical protein U1E36_02520 [Rickettsiales bacterium]
MMYDFGKTMIVCQMEHDKSHEGVLANALITGITLAVAPLNGNRFGDYYSYAPAEAERMMKISYSEMNAWVAEQFQYRLGNMRLDSERFAYPLRVYAIALAQRFALVGDAAVGMHPVTAHGFNFALVRMLCVNRSELL